MHQYHRQPPWKALKQKKFNVTQETKEIELTDFLKDIFSSHYTEFLLNFGTE